MIGGIRNLTAGYILEVTSEVCQVRCVLCLTAAALLPLWELIEPRGGLQPPSQRRGLLWHGRCSASCRALGV